MTVEAAPTAARLLRDAIEPFHGLCYYVPELRRTYVEDLGLHPWAAYFGQRAAAMGAVDAAVVAATFYGFSPRLVEKSVPSVWDAISPQVAWDDRLAGVSDALDRLLPEVDQAEVDATADLAARAVSAMPTAGRPLGAAHTAMPDPEPPLLRLWKHTSSLREYRGDGHVAALVSHEVGPVESLVTATGFSNLSASFHRKARGWSDDEWEAGALRAREAGWIDEEGRLTPSGRDLRLSIESATDRTMGAVVTALDAVELDRLTSTLTALSRTVIEAGGFPA